MPQTVAIIPARGGSKGIPGKNIINVGHQPLITWSIQQALEAKQIDSVFVSSDDDEILRISEQCGAGVIKRPDNISSDTASSESAWLHAIDHIESYNVPIEWIVGMQATSPLRSSRDLDQGLTTLKEHHYDSLLSVTEVEDFFTWQRTDQGLAESVNYDYRKRMPRQQIKKKYLENGSFYIFSPNILRKYKNRLGGRVGMHVMDRHKMFQIDNPEDIKLCETIMKGYSLDQPQ